MVLPFLLLVSSIGASLDESQQQEQSPQQCSPRPLEVVLETPLFTSNSYAVVGSFLALALHSRPDVNLRLVRLSNFVSSWPALDAFDERRSALLHAIPMVSRLPPPSSSSSESSESTSDTSSTDDARVAHTPADVTVRVTIDFDGPQVPSSSTLVLATTENGYLAQEVIWGSSSPRLNPNGVLVVVPSEWSRSGMLNSGVKAEDVFVVPHGIDCDLFGPLPADERDRRRADKGWDKSFVFLNISAMTANKNPDLLILAFEDLTKRFNNLKLVLKGNDDLYRSELLLLSSPTTGAVFQRLRSEGLIEYYGGQMSFSEIALLHQLSDTYVSPYSFEGFNLPVLEAMSVGNPVVVTRGGSTDDFVPDDGSFGYKVDADLVVKDAYQKLSGKQAVEDEGTIRQDDGLYITAKVMYLKVSLPSLVDKMVLAVLESAEWRAKIPERIAFVRQTYSWTKIAERIIELGVKAAKAANDKN